MCQNHTYAWGAIPVFCTKFGYIITYSNDTQLRLSRQEVFKNYFPLMHLFPTNSTKFNILSTKNISTKMKKSIFNQTTFIPS